MATQMQHDAASIAARATDKWLNALCADDSVKVLRVRWETMRSALQQVIETLLDTLADDGWQQAVYQPLKTLQFLADQLNLPLPETLTAFLRLRPVLVEALTERLGDAQSARDRVTAVWDEGIVRLVTARQHLSQIALEAAHRKYLALFEQASDAFLLIRMDEKGTIVEANEAAAKLTGYDRAALIGASALTLAPDDDRLTYARALQRLRRDGQVRLPSVPLLRRDGTRVQVDLSGSLLRFNGETYALCAARNITEQAKMQEELERVIAERTQELQAALERERHRAAQLAVLADIAAHALVATDLAALYQAAVNAVHRYLHLYNAAVFVVDAERGELELAACRGAYETVWTRGHRQRIETGVLGWVARTGDPVVVNEVSQDPRYFRATPQEAATQAELVVPIKVEGVVIGVVDLQSDRPNDFDDDDLHMAQAVADQLAHAVQALQNFQRVRLLQELNEQIVRSLPDAVALLNERGEVIAANDLFCQGLCAQPSERALGRLWHEVLPSDFLHACTASGVNLAAAIDAALKRGEPAFFAEIPHRDTWWDLRVIPAHSGQSCRVTLYLRDASLRVRRIYQLETLLAIGQAMESTIDLHPLLHAILTAATAGPGLGFNRAILFLVDKEAQMLRVAMAVGALTAEEAYATWARLAAERKTLWDFLREYPGDTAVRQAPLMQRVHDLVVRLDEDNLLTLCLRRHEPLRIANPRGELRLPERLRQVLSDSDAICVPLVAQEEPLGLIVADNAFSRHPITEEAERLLRLFASSASIALRNAQLIAQLKDALRREQAMREQLVHSERLAAIGELAAKVAHDLRSPLVTIGGYARQLERHPSDPERVMRNAQIIVDEVERLERQLRDLLDFAKPSPPKPQRCALTELVQRLVEVHRPSMEAGRVRVVAELSDDPCWVLADEMQIERLLMNLWRNAVEAMPDGGVLTVKVWRDGAQVRLRIKDTGVGISPEALPHIFKPFYTTKHGGTGLGLAIAQKIVAEHSGTLEIHSEVGVGTTVDIALPAAPA